LEFNDAKEDYFKFIDYFGTHFINKIEMGARYGFLEKTSVKEYSSGSNYSASLSVSGSYGAASLSAKVAGSTENSKSGASSQKNVKAFSIGVPPPADGNPLSWAEKTLSEPMPIKYSVRAITEIFTNRFFDLSQLKHETVKIDTEKFTKNLKLALDAYCPEYLKPRGKTSFCTSGEFDQVLRKITDEKQNLNTFKIENGAVFRIKNVFTGRCINYNGNRQKLTLEPCSSDNNQVFKLMFISQFNAFRVVTNGPLSSGQWDWGKDANRLYIWDYGEDLSNWRHFTFTKEANEVYRIRPVLNANACLQAISNENKEIHLQGCSGVVADFIITKA